jgi:hypothetical protein
MNYSIVIIITLIIIIIIIKIRSNNIINSYKNKINEFINISSKNNKKTKSILKRVRFVE